jgi:hypothetical protein
MLTRRQRLIACVVVACAWAVTALVGIVVYSPPAPRPADIPSNEFSAERARVILKDLVGAGLPHPFFERQNAIVRQRILDYFHEFGYETEVQFDRQSLVRQAKNIKNIIARRPGSEGRGSVMLVGHYDSVPYGPGACDDGVAVAAILEIARMMREQPETRNEVFFLLTDGEEAGLFGARSFVGAYPRAAEVKVAINLVARGTSGPSLMFQTSDNDSWLIPLFARHVTRPVTSSLFAEVYKALPINTDFTIFKQAGIDGYNFAFIRDAQNYHTARDTYENADPGSLQHQGDNAWQLLRAVADFDLDKRTGGRVIYTDLMGQTVVWWPASINRALAAGIVGLTILAGAIARRRGLFPGIHWRIFQSIPLVLVLTLVASVPCDRVAGFEGLQGELWVEQGVQLLLLYWAVALFAALLLFRFTLLGRVGPWSAWLGVWLWWNVVGLVVAFYLPGASYLFILPGAVAAVSGLLAALLPARRAPSGLAVACCLGPIAAGVLWLPMQVLLYDSVGFMRPAVYALCAGLLVMTALPLAYGPPLRRRTVAETNLPVATKVDGVPQPA